MDIASYEDRSEPESLRIEITENKIIPLFEDRESELRTMDNKVTGEDRMKETEKQNLNLM